MADINPRPLQWTNVDALGEATLAALYGKDGTPKHRTQFPPAEPENHFTPMKGPAETAKLTRGEIVVLTAMSVIGIALIVSGLVWL